MATIAYGDGKVINVPAPTGGVTAGAVYEGTGAIGVWLDTVAEGVSAPLALTGEFTLAKETGAAHAVGDLLFWDASNDRLDKTATNIFAGICTVAADSNATSVRVSLNIGSTLIGS
jgi:predicted RecA/RadA family phage recombinase